jgi:hypothetical protein
LGIDIHGLNFIRYASRKKRLGSVATIGRQGLMLPSLCTQYGPFCEEFLKKEFEAVRVDSYDYSGYEGATHIVDMNQPIGAEQQYDTIIDCGCLEHVYNAPQALMNVSLLCADDGQIIHVLPANNFCGHGFWQFSPELFFSLYSTANGYRETEVFIADLTNNTAWFEVKRPENGRRAEAVSQSPLYVMCRTVKTSSFSHANVQQSDYVSIWSNDAGAPVKQNARLQGLKRVVKSNPFVYRVVLGAYRTAQSARHRLKNPVSLSNRNPHLRKRGVSDLLRGGLDGTIRADRSRKGYV